MVRPNDEISEGIDANKSVKLSDELKAANKNMDETAYPEGEPTKTALNVRGDIEPEVKG